MKRFLSILLACTMLLSMVTISHAADETEVVTVEYWNADSTKITIDLSKEVDEAVLKAATTVTQNGTPVEFTVSKKSKITDGTATDTASSDAKIELAAMIPTTETTYEIAPANGLNFTDLYSITVGSAVTGSDAWNKNFKVKKLWKEDFNSYTITDGSNKGTDTNMPWYGEAINSLGLEDNGSGDKAMFIVSGGKMRIRPSYASDKANNTTAFADTGIAASTYWASGSEARKQSEYNIELDLRMTTSHSTPKYAAPGFGIAMLNCGHDQVIYGSSAGIAAGFQVVYNSKYSAIAGNWGHGNYTYNTIASYSSNYNNTATTGAYYWYNFFAKGYDYADSSSNWLLTPFKRNTTLDDGDWTNDTVQKVNLSVKNSNLKYSIDDSYINYDFNAYAGNTNQNFGVIALFGNNASSGNTYYVDNIIATKAVEVTVVTLTASDFTASKANIKFNLNKDIPAENLKDAVTLKKDGAIVSDFTLEQIEDTQYTYEIVPAGGVALGAAYTVDIAAGYYADAEGGINQLAAVSQDVKIVPVSVSEPTYINANSTKITIDLPENVDADALADAISLIHVSSGESVDFTVEKRVKTVNTNTTTTPTNTNMYVVTPMELTTETTYDIIPTGGVELDEVYYLAILTSTGMWSKAFKVEKLWIENFDNYTITDEETCEAAFPWKLARGSSDSGVFGLKDIGSGNKVMYLQHQSSTNYAVMPAYLADDANSSVNFADTGVPASEYWAKNSEAIKKTEYNVELDLRFWSNLSDAIYGHGFNILMRYPYAPNDQTLYGNNGIIAGVNGGKKNGSNYTHMMLAATYGYGDYTYGSVASAQVNGLTSTAPNYWHQDFYGAPYVESAQKSDVTWATSLFTKSNLTDGNWTNDTVHKVAMSVKDSNLKFSFDNGFENYDFTPFSSTATNHNGLVTFNGGGNGSQPNRYVIDNIVVTQFNEITDKVTYGDLIVTIDGNQIPDLIGAETISASINVMNLDDVLPCKVVLAVYDSSNKSLKNAVVSDILEIGKGITPFVFNNVALNGGDIIEVFFWDGFEKLTPYRAPASFPAEE